MSEGETVIFIFAAIVAVIAMALTSRASMPALVFRGNPGPGLVRLSVLASMAWILFVLLVHSDPSVRNDRTYIIFYFVIGYAVTKTFGQGGGALFGPRIKVDVYERRSFPAALFIATFTLATGLIYGASNWGEADPFGDDEGGWWIPLGFFFMGWMILVGALAFFAVRETIPLRKRILQNRSLPDAGAAAAYTLSIAAVVSEAVAGDFFGWLNGLMGLGVIVVMIVVHEVLGIRHGPAPTTAPIPAPVTGRVLESLLYLALALGFWLIQRWLSAWPMGASG